MRPLVRDALKNASFSLQALVLFSRAMQRRVGKHVALLACAHAAAGTFASAASAEDARTQNVPAAARIDLIAKGAQLFDDQQYEESIQTLSAALLRPSNTTQQRSEIYRLLALNFITLGRRDEADNAIRAVLVLQPDYQLPLRESPRFRDVFAAARQKWEDEGRPGLVIEETPRHPVKLTHVSPSQAEAKSTITLSTVLDDPDGRVAYVVLFYRSSTRGKFIESPTAGAGASLRAKIPGSAVRPPLVEYYFLASDAKGQPLVGNGDAATPLRIAVPEPSRTWIVPVAVGGGLLGAAAIIGGLALAGAFNGEKPKSTVSINVTEASFRLPFYP